MPWAKAATGAADDPTNSEMRYTAIRSRIARRVVPAGSARHEDRSTGRPPDRLEWVAPGPLQKTSPRR